MASLNYLDDSDWSIDPADEPTHLWIPLAGVIVAAILLTAGWMLNHVQYQCGPSGMPRDFQSCSIVWVREAK